MFNNLVESSSHRRELKRRGSYLFFTAITYVVFFAIAGVISINAYDARLTEQNLELVTLMRVVEFPATVPPAAQPQNPTTPRNTNPSDNRLDHYVRREAMASTARPDLVPDQVSTAANPNLPMPKSGIVRFDSYDADPGPGSDPNSSGTVRAQPKPVIVSVPQDPPPLFERPVPAVVRKKVINSEAILLPKPPYPLLAKQARAQGEVTVQVLVDESGKVVSARVLKGHPLLSHAAQAAAYQARFSPTTIGNQPVKVSGMITYNFILQ
jgi:TonB family protein